MIMMFACLYNVTRFLKFTSCCARLRMLKIALLWKPNCGLNVPKVNEGSAGDLNLIGWTGDYGDPDNFLGTFFRNYNPQFGFHNPAIEGILNRALNQPNFAKRVALYKQANIMIMKYLPGVPYAHATPALGAQKRVQKLIATPVGRVWFQGVTVGGQ